MGLVLVLAGVVLLLDVGGAARFVIRHLTSKNLGSLAPGYAASRGGFRVYAVLILAVGLAAAGLGLSTSWPLAGFAILGLGAVVFAIATVVAIKGEAVTYRALDKKP